MVLARRGGGDVGHGQRTAVARGEEGGGERDVADRAAGQVVLPEPGEIETVDRQRVGEGPLPDAPALLGVG